VPLDMLDRLCLDPGTRTLGELMQEREWAVSEIRRLRTDVSRLSQKREALRIEREMEQTEVAHAPGRPFGRSSPLRGVVRLWSEWDSEAEDGSSRT
jgi:hypothetical protein